MIRKCIAWILTATLTLGDALTAIAETTGSVEPPKAAVDKIDRIEATLGLMRQSLDRSQFDLDALLEASDYDAVTLIDFVRDEISYQPYEGSLRGPLGTLWARAGNSLDQSILLAKLLNDAGYEARIAEGSMTSALESSLTESVLRSNTPAPAIADGDGFDRAIRDLDATVAPLEFSTDELQALSSGNWEFAPDFLAETTKTADMLAQLAPSDFTEKSGGTIPTEGGRYFWVQYRDDAVSWKNIHPALDATVTSKETSAERFLVGSVPEELQHRVRFELFLEVAVNGELKRIPLMSPWERPAAVLTGVTLTMTNSPMGLDGMMESIASAATGDAAELERAIRHAANEDVIFMPVFSTDVGEVQAFDLHGNTIDPFAVSDPASGLFQSLNEKMSSAVDEIGGPGTAPVTTGQILVVTTTGPGAGTKSHERYIFDRLDPQSRASGEYQLAERGGPTHSVFADVTVLASTAPPPKAKLIDTFLEQLLRLIPLAKFVAQLNGPGIVADRVDTAAMNKTISDVLQGSTRNDMLTMVSLMDAPFAHEGGVYRSTPMLLEFTRKIAFSSDGTSFLELMDIVDNEVTAIKLADTDKLIELDPSTGLRKGVWDTWIETQLFGNPELVSDYAPIELLGSTDWSRFRLAKSATVYVGLDSMNEIKAKVPGLAWRGIQEDLRNGFAVVLPSSQAEPSSGVAWWRLDPVSGTTLGRSYDGRGGAFAISIVGGPVLEYLKNLFAGVSWSFIVGRFCQGLMAYYICWVLKVAEHTMVGAVQATRAGNGGEILMGRGARVIPPPNPRSIARTCLPVFGAGVLVGLPSESKELAKFFVYFVVAMVDY